MENKQQAGLMIEAGRTSLGLELGSTRMKAVLIGEDRRPLASGTHDWENRLEDGIWTYPLEAVWQGIQDVYQKLAAAVKEGYGVCLCRVGAMGVSAMMHGYLPFDAAGRQLAPFRTWRNTTTEQAAAALTETFHFNIPQRWSIAHLYHAVRAKEPHVGQIAHLTTLAGYVHWQLTGQQVVGVGEASGMFPIDSATGDYDARMMQQFDGLVAPYGHSWRLGDILPRVLAAGQPAGSLTEAGARRLDPSGRLESGVPFCPPEGDAGTGMVATGAVAPRTGNVSAGTSIFAMIVLEKPLKAVHEEIDMVTTPSGAPVAMVHCNNCTSDFDAWVRLFGQVLNAMGAPWQKPALYDAVYQQALLGRPDAGGILSYNYYSGEPIARMEEGRPLLARLPGGAFDLPDFARALLYATVATLRLGMDILTKEEQVGIELLQGHGGLFKTPRVGQAMMAAALNIPVAVMEAAGEGGAWGIALLADYMRRGQGHSLEDYLAKQVFAQAESLVLSPTPADVAGFEAYLARYKAGLPIEKAAVQHLKQA